MSTEDVPKQDWNDEYQQRVPLFERLTTEVQFAIRAGTRRERIKTHSISGRVKSAESMAEKAARKELDRPLEQLDDIVGVRVVVLFQSDLPRLEALIERSFEVHRSDDKIADRDPATFGYMSVHFLAELGDEQSGPRYDDLKGIPFEIQTRTVVMDAWANVSHHLDYKGESSVPEELRRDFFALSGLFYVADQHFEIFAARAKQSQVRAKEEIGQVQNSAIEVNLDTMEAYLIRRYADRRHVDRASISEFVEEVARFGYADFNQLDEALDRGDAGFKKYESNYVRDFNIRVESPDRYMFADLAAARLSLLLADEQYALSYRGDISDLREYAVWNRSPPGAEPESRAAS